MVADSLIKVVNNSALTIAAGSENNGYVAFYALIVTDSETENNTRVINDYTFMLNNGDWYLIDYSGTDTELQLPDKSILDEDITTYSIYQYVFNESQTLTSVVIPDCVAAIGEYAFADCQLLNSVTIGSGMTSIATRAFAGCSALDSLTISG